MTTRFGVVGSGWRSEFFVRVARLMPDRFECVGVPAYRNKRGGRPGAPASVVIPAAGLTLPP